MEHFDVNRCAVPFKKNEQLICKDASKNCMFLILNGRVGIYKSHDKGTTIVKELGSGEFVGAVAFFSNRHQNKKFIALEDTLAVRIGEDNLNDFISSHPGVIVKLMANLSDKLRVANEAYSQNGVDGFVYKEGIEVEPPDIMEGRMYPKGHQKYPKKIDEGHMRFVSDKSIKCPVCEKSFRVYEVKWSKLKLLENRRDFRKIYEDFDGNWYDIWACPHCHYANAHDAFFKLNALQKKDLKLKLENLIELRVKCELLKRNYDQVFQDYYLALVSKFIIHASSFELGHLWIKLAWLYQDCNHTEMFEMAYRQARQYYCDGLFNSKRTMDIAEEQKMFILIGEMYIVEKDYDNAKKYFSMGIKNSVGNMAMNLAARKRLEIVDELVLVTDD